MTLFERVLRENTHEMLPFSDDDDFLEIEVEDLDDEYVKAALEKIEHQPNWKYAAGDGDNAYEYLASSIDESASKSFLITDHTDHEMLGYIIFYLDTQSRPDDGIREISLLGFRENNITLIKDVFKLFDMMRKQYTWIEWSVANANPIKRAYDKKIIEWKGKTIEKIDSTIYHVGDYEYEFNLSRHLR
jgi:hypothetical protein